MYVLSNSTNGTGCPTSDATVRTPSQHWTGSYHCLACWHGTIWFHASMIIIDEPPKYNVSSSTIVLSQMTHAVKGKQWRAVIIKLPTCMLLFYMTYMRQNVKQWTKVTEALNMTTLLPTLLGLLYFCKQILEPISLHISPRHATVRFANSSQLLPLSPDLRPLDNTRLARCHTLHTALVRPGLEYYTHRMYAVMPQSHWAPGTPRFTPVHGPG